MIAAIAPLHGREQFIPPRKRELFEALAADLDASGGAAAVAGRFYELVVACIHHQFLRQLELLHDTYHLVDPDEPTRPNDAEAIEAAYATVSTSLEQVLQSANFREVDATVAQRAQTEAGRVRAPLRNSAAQFRTIRLFRRGEHSETLTRRSLYGLRQTVETIAVYDEVVLLAALKPDAAHVPPRRGRRRRLAVPRGSVMIKYFHDIAVADLDALYPGAEVVFSMGDRLSLGLPALIAGVPLAIKFVPALLVLYGVLRFYLGGQPPSAANLGEALVVAGGLLAVGGFVGNQWTKFQRRALLHQRELNDMIYFHNVTNNVGIFDHLIRDAEEQDAKEALLAYFTLLAAPSPPTQDELDSLIEHWVKARFSLEVDFEVDDALRKLDAYGLLVRSGERLSVLPLREACAALDRRWDDFFTCVGPPKAA